MTPGPFVAAVPAGGSGHRMGRDTPKQYLPLCGRLVVEWAMEALLDQASLRRLVVALPAEDRTFTTLSVARDPRVHTVTGGATRAASVRAALRALADEGSELPVLVHDAARPCLHGGDVERLLGALAQAPGALLGIPVRDTLKRADASGAVAETVPRSGLWQALTPQAFRLDRLLAALERFGDDARVSDEASAMELAGHAARLVEGDPANIKITRPQDLPLAEAILASRFAARSDH